ncbi:MAG: S8 family serine peptidase, partial [Gammaproteobacteria bacterium]|nr:S8 family serine peptidase [Gammaproteobacteria bacterium]
MKKTRIIVALLILPLSVTTTESSDSTTGRTQATNDAYAGETTWESLQRTGVAVVSVALKPATGVANAGRATINRAVASRQQTVLDTLMPGGYEIMHRFQSVPGLTLRVTDGVVLEQLTTHPMVRRVDLEVGGSGGLAQSGPWVNADVAHANGITGAGRTVAVLDTGIDTDHVDLVSSLVQEQCLCNTGVDCCPTGGSSGSGPGSAEDDNGHGTHVSGIVTSDGTVAPLGIAPDSDIVAVKMMDATNGFCCASEVTAALDWVLNNRPDVDAVNMSLGTFAEFAGDCDTETAWTINMAAAVDALRDAGVLSMAATLNNSNAFGVSVPACLSGAVAVGATFDNSDTIAAFSNSSPSLDILAPGVSIRSTANTGTSVIFNGT